jgi:phospholipid transport system substrate-binding protein
VLSRNWQTATPTQQAEFLKAFEESQVLAWSQKFKSYNGEKLETLGAKMESEGVWLVDAQIVKQPGPPSFVQWRLQTSEDGSLRVTDIIAKGMSMALAFRQDYTTILQSNGQDIDALLATIRTRNIAIAKKQ